MPSWVETSLGATLGTSLVGSLFTSRLVADVAPLLPKADNISLASLTPTYMEKLPASVQSIIATGYSEALVPPFGYFVPLCILGFMAMLFLQKHPLAHTINHGGTAQKDVVSPSDTSDSNHTLRH